MPGFVHFLQCVGRAVVKNGGRALANLVPFGDVAFEIARDALDEYRRDSSEADLRQGIEELAQASATAVRDAAATVAKQEATDQPAEIRIALTSFLEELPERIREWPKPANEGALVAQLATHLAQPLGPNLANDGNAPLTVTSPKRTYTLERLLAIGDVADLHRAHAPGDRSDADTAYVMKISRVPEGYARLDNERRVLADLLTRAGDLIYRRFLPTLAESFPATDRFRKRVNVFLYEDGLYTLEQVHARHPALDGRHLAWIFKRLLMVLGFAHKAGVVHGAVLPSHVLLHPADHGLCLVGWGQSVAAGLPIEAIVARQRDWYPPEVRYGRGAAPATDVCMAARCMTYLAGGDPVRDRLPETLPEPLRRFLRSCVLEGIKMRPADAWALHDEFDEVLRELYGPPQFHELTMT